MHSIPTRILLRIPPVWGVDLSITNEVLILFFAGLVTAAVLASACRRRGPLAKGPFQNAVEGLVEFIETSVVKEGIGPDGLVWAPVLLTLFFFILFTNLTGMLPFPSHAQAMTANLNVTGALAAVVFALTIGIGITRRGAAGFLRGFVPAGVPGWMLVLVVPIEVISWLARPVSLAVRLFANMLAGHALIFIFIGLTASSAWFLKPLPLLGAVFMSCFELFVSFIQAFVFTLLAGMYIKEALEVHA